MPGVDSDLFNGLAKEVIIKGTGVDSDLFNGLAKEVIIKGTAF